MNGFKALNPSGSQGKTAASLAPNHHIAGPASSQTLGTMDNPRMLLIFSLVYYIEQCTNYHWKQFRELWQGLYLSASID